MEITAGSLAAAYRNEVTCFVTPTHDFRRYGVEEWLLFMQPM
jgi:hypothetical protein